MAITYMHTNVAQDLFTEVTHFQDSWKRMPLQKNRFQERAVMPNSLQIFYYAASLKKAKAGLETSNNNFILKPEILFMHLILKNTRDREFVECQNNFPF